jgi:hypothetical protein
MNKNPQRKAKKPARIKGVIQSGLVPVKKSSGYVGFVERPTFLLLPIDNPDALVEQVARAINDEYRKAVVGEPDDETLARAALRSIGVPIKGGEK